MHYSNEKKEWIETIKAVILTIIVALTLQFFVLSTSIVEGESMEPTLHSGNRIIFNKLVYLIGKPDRGDVVIIQQDKRNYVKRVIALPEETIEIRNHVIYINNRPIDQSYLPDQYVNRTANFGPVTVPKDHYFVMGDNRGISKDSRNGLGFIYEKNIVGRSELIIYPFSDFSWTK